MPLNPTTAERAGHIIFLQTQTDVTSHKAACSAPGFGWRITENYNNRGEKKKKKVEEFKEKSLAAEWSSFRIPLMRAWTQLNGQVTIGRKRSDRRADKQRREVEACNQVEPVGDECIMLCVCMCVCEFPCSSLLIQLIESMCSHRYELKVRCAWEET